MHHRTDSHWILALHHMDSAPWLVVEVVAYHTGLVLTWVPHHTHDFDLALVAYPRIGWEVTSEHCHTRLYDPW